MSPLVFLKHIFVECKSYRNNRWVHNTIHLLTYSHTAQHCWKMSLRGKANYFIIPVFSGPVTTTSLLVPGPSMDTGELEVVETSLIEMPSVSLGIPAPRRFVEDDGPEWRELDYLVQVIKPSSSEVFFYDYLQIGTPPPTFFLFFQQYDWNIYTGETLSHKVELSNYNIYPVHAFNPFQDIEERKNLLIQFRKWKKRKRKTFNIVVTERSRREMAEQEEEKNKKRIPPSK